MTEKLTVPLIALRDIVLFPGAIEPLLIGRTKSVNAVCKTYEEQSDILVVTQKDPSIDEINANDLYNVGTIGHIHNFMKLNDGTVKVLIKGLYRVSIDNISDEDDIIKASYTKLQNKSRNSKMLEGLKRALISAFEQFYKYNKKLPQDVLNMISNIDDPSQTCDMIASYLPLKMSEQQEILELVNVKKRIEKLIFIIESQTELFLVEKKIKSRVRKQVEKSQKEYYLNEQLKAINRELGNSEEQPDEIKELKHKIKSLPMSKEASNKALQELNRLKNIPNFSQESVVIKNYIDWLIGIPWSQSKEELSMEYAEEMLNKHHYGLDKIKDRILEYIAVYKRTKKVKSQILCFVGPPGVGKTSLGKSIADAMKRPFARISLGGVTDEAEIRGHRRTYVGAMPGRLIQTMKRSSVTNPIIMLDEIDKLGSDPESALLEVLDPEQNSTFTDNYLEVQYDLSKVIFIATANSFDISLPLLDRMEVIQLNGYTEEEKLKIAKDFIIPKQIEENGLKNNEIKFDDNAILNIVRYYTMESGVRNLERKISKITRKVVRKLVSSGSEENQTITITADSLQEYLGIKKYNQDIVSREPTVGVVNGLAWTETGGDVLTIEALKIPGTGQLLTTGKLGEVMQESMKAAYSFVKSQYQVLKIEEEDLSKYDIHVHVPEGAVPKDGPSAGITICTAIVSAFTSKKPRSDVAMTGEITLVGKVLPIGGLREKLLAARRNGINNILIPKDNEKDIDELPNILKNDLNIKCVKHINEVLQTVLI
ncbi:MAG: endopeptidase La [Alphaproteobacteria bacterium]|nr:endopeptidase La [Alphaproteobacteria bacterium]